jgi:hypothetical protein
LDHGSLRHYKWLSNKAVLSGVQNFVIAIGKPIRHDTMVVPVSCRSIRMEH